MSASDYSPFSHPDDLAELRFRVRYAETDPMGFVHNANYLVYLEMGRIEALRQRGVSYRELEASGYLIVVARADLRFRAPARMDDEVILELGLSHASRARLQHSYRLWRGEREELCLEAETTLACVTPEGQLQAMPREVLETVPERVPGVRR